MFCGVFYTGEKEDVGSQSVELSANISSLHFYLLWIISFMYPPIPMKKRR